MRESYLRPLLWLTVVQAVVTLLAGLNLVIPAMATRVGVGEFVRWREIFSLLFVTPASAGLMVMAIWLLERGRGDSWSPLLAITVSICLVAISMGVHEPINVLGRGAGDRLRETVFFWDEVFSHASFFAGFAGVSLSLIWGQARNPLGAAMGLGAFFAFLGCGLVAGVGIFFSLVRAPDIRIDLVIIAVVIALAELLRRGRPFGVLPLAVALETGYALALVGLLLRGR